MRGTLPMLALLLVSCSSAGRAAGGSEKAKPPADGLSVATFAGGCFWCMEPPFEKTKGVVSAVSGYTGGSEAGPAYKEVAYGRTGHRESVRVTYDPKKVSYEELLQVFWRSMDPTDGGGQFADRGDQYAPAIFVHDAAQREAAKKSKAALQKSGRFEGEDIVVPILEAADFWVAEDDHQDFYEKNPSRYQNYSRGSGRVGFLKKHWGGDEAPGAEGS